MAVAWEWKDSEGKVEEHILSAWGMSALQFCNCLVGIKHGFRKKALSISKNQQIHTIATISCNTLLYCDAEEVIYWLLKIIMLSFNL